MQIDAFQIEIILMSQCFILQCVLMVLKYCDVPHKCQCVVISQGGGKCVYILK